MLLKYFKDYKSIIVSILILVVGVLISLYVYQGITKKNNTLYYDSAELVLESVLGNKAKGHVVYETSNNFYGVSKSTIVLEKTDSGFLYRGSGITDNFPGLIYNDFSGYDWYTIEKELSRLGHNTICELTSVNDNTFTFKELDSNKSFECIINNTEIGDE